MEEETCTKVETKAKKDAREIQVEVFQTNDDVVFRRLILLISEELN